MEGSILHSAKMHPGLSSPPPSLKHGLTGVTQQELTENLGNTCLNIMGHGKQTARVRTEGVLESESVEGSNHKAGFLSYFFPKAHRGLRPDSTHSNHHTE